MKDAFTIEKLRQVLAELGPITPAPRVWMWESQYPRFKAELEAHADFVGTSVPLHCIEVMMLGGEEKPRDGDWHYSDGKFLKLEFKRWSRELWSGPREPAS